MANDGKSANDPSGNNPAHKEQTSGDRKEKMNKSAADAFGKQSSASSGTTPLAGESTTGNDKPEPGGVEGTGGNP